MPGRVAVAALRLGADHGGLDAARAALEDHAVAVDEEVVTDVVPAVGVAVVAGDAEDDPGRFLRRVVDRGRPCGGRTRPARCRSSAPVRGGTWSAPQLARGTIARRAAGLRGARARRGRVGEGAHEARPEAAALAAQAQLELVGGAGERRGRCRRRRAVAGAAAASSASSGRRGCARGPAPGGCVPRAQRRPARSKRRGAGEHAGRAPGGATRRARAASGERELEQRRRRRRSAGRGRAARRARRRPRRGGAPGGG